MLTFTSRAMNTDILTAGLSKSTASNVFSWFQTMEQQFSRFLPESELSRVNRLAGTDVAVSARFIQVLHDALYYHEQTDGLFSPFLGSTLHHLGYRKTFETISQHTVKDAGSPETVLQPMTVDFDERLLNISPQNLLDFGGFVKGWSVEQIAGKVKQDGKTFGLIDAGGDLMAWSDHNSEPSWLVGIAHPYDDHSPIVKLKLKVQTGIATSSSVKRRWHSGTAELHHIIDPRTHLPAQSDCVQVTVIGKTLVPCEVYAKCLMILGSEKGAEWLKNKRADLAYIIVGKDGRLTMSANLAEYCQDVQVTKG